MSEALKRKMVRDLVKDKAVHIRSSKLSLKEQMEVRRDVLSMLTHTTLSNISNPLFNIESASTKNCENLIGKTETPLGIAGPLRVNGDYAKGEFFIPLATTEGALVASVNRGCNAIKLSDGAFVYIEQSGMTRAPLFHTAGLKESRKFVSFIKSHFKEISKRVHQTDIHLTLLSINPFVAGRNVFLRFVFDTQDAMGMNMVTLACDHVIKNYIEKETNIPCIALSGNLCTDKKASWMNKIEKRGYSVHAEVTIPEKIVKEVLKTNPRDFVDINTRKNLIGSALAGSLGFNAHHANIIAAIFLATGQDMAHVAEASSGITTTELTGHDLYISVSLPDLPVGTIGGGTDLATQKEALSILGVAGGGSPPGSNAKKFAEIIAASVLAGEISLLAALGSGDLAKAHRWLGRGEKKHD
ncbi:hydroxymethylglutaryl-CoA reductase (NADPH) [Candidatus Woesebacteria bacterium RIFCSPHIGHO2_01_FULL_38_9b]|uniref:3-hydroxy-3-methylglutaryl coenzyme A reductase n=1 Tax=Candidatus Woesebacteria bacterium RIFCSPHIGHO2_01_FULL_38_9b TaxID=1802493 RepID=A0A1F7Y2Z1_9BACT|nr:MAG: hydroxymethylglutaryl-CoA reductase (NADPH) [Candidatus Woesebacteria bacterium RIFCSPHIGHO2_01_FULL_38_9b]